ncbi:hypothetical protein [Shimia biformata]|uniref:hypothetical protein n=1 Tax=Shimia biformata TaxID=1294299 RepID=UPI00194F0A67|nr:hypothetical protein [Shimia biformata]
MDLPESDVIDLTPLTKDAPDMLPAFFADTGDRYLNNPRYFYFNDYSDGIYKLEKIAVRITEDDKVAITFIEKVHRGIYTHTRNRRVWTGPWIKVTLFDQGDFPIGGEWDAVRCNRVCRTPERRQLAEKDVPGAYGLVSRVGVARGPYRYTNC